MAPLRFRVTRNQLGGLVFVIGAAAFVALIVVASLRVPSAGQDPMAARGQWFLIEAAVAAVMLIPFTLVFLLARTEFTPSGIRARTVFWWRLLTWDNVAQISVGPKWGFCHGVIVTTIGGEPFPLMVPVSGGPLADPDFDHKTGQILDYWRTFGSGTADEGIQAGLITELPDIGSDEADAQGYRAATETVSDPAARLRKLHDLRDAGLLTQDEYEAKRADIERVAPPAGEE